jgi:mono/diheme cytochrome c family protein
MLYSTRVLLSALAVSLALVACGKSGEGSKAAAPDPAEGPADIAVPEIAASNDVAAGEKLFASKGCSACHKIGGGKLVGPDLQGVTTRRKKKWIARMILHPDQMLQKDATARELLKVHMTPMPPQNVDPQSELPAILAFLESHAN